MNLPLRIAGVGAGYYARFHVEAWASMDRVKYAAICDQDIQKARTLARRFDIPCVFASAEEMLDTVRPDVVDIVTPPETHLALGEAAFRRGIATVCQKPLAPDLASALHLVERAEATGTPLLVHENFRFRPWFREAARLIEEGRIGTVYSIAFRLRPGDGRGSDAYLDRQPYFRRMDRFLIHETAIHFVDSFRCMLGEVVAVTALLRRLNPAIVGEDAGYVIFEFESGATGLFDGNRLVGHPAIDTARTLGEMWIEGSAGVLRLDGDARLWWAPHRQPQMEHAYDRVEHLFAGGAVRALQENVVDHLTAGVPAANTGRDYLVNMRVEEAVYRSHREQRRITMREMSSYRQ